MLGLRLARKSSLLSNALLLSLDALADRQSYAFCQVPVGLAIDLVR